jgi:hypothetical protein
VKNVNMTVWSKLACLQEAEMLNLYLWKIALLRGLLLTLVVLFLLHVVGATLIGFGFLSPPFFFELSFFSYPIFKIDAPAQGKMVWQLGGPGSLLLAGLFFPLITLIALVWLALDRR